MRYAQMLELSEEARLSPEKLAAMLGVSGMTLRRWRGKPPSGELPKLYERAFEKGVEQLVVDGHLAPDSKLAASVMAKSSQVSFQARIKSLGFSDALLKRKGNPAETLMIGLSEIGAPPERVQEVERNKAKIGTFAKLGADWKERITGLLSVIRSPELNLVDKLVAYGALFYLLAPFDLIPDSIPVFGLLDDYAILGLALAYYAARYPHLLAKRKPK
jgi:uncharacterized membrane protein YkvA (DUF1232 family)